MARPKTNMKDDEVTCPECGYGYRIALDKQEAYCRGKRTSDSIPHKKLMRMT